MVFDTKSLNIYLSSRFRFLTLSSMLIRNSEFLE
jgi:hypothetical protein